MTHSSLAASHKVRRRRWGLRAVALLAGALAASLLSAWVPAAIEGWRAVRNTPPGRLCESTPPGSTQARLLLVWEHPAQRRWRTWSPPPPPPSVAPGTFEDSPLQTFGKVEWPSFLPDPQGKPGFDVCADAFGWPWVCMRRVTTFQAMPDGSVQVDFAPGREAWMLTHDGKWYLIPLRPVWPGFVANAVVFGVLFGALCLGPGAARRAVRRARGACTSCGYSLAGNTGACCPECGARAKDLPT
jgi:hypothetical protein